MGTVVVAKMGERVGEGIDESASEEYYGRADGGAEAVEALVISHDSEAGVGRGAAHEYWHASMLRNRVFVDSIPA